jgi:hypothetical protein
MGLHGFSVKDLDEMRDLLSHETVGMHSRLAVLVFIISFLLICRSTSLLL